MKEKFRQFFTGRQGMDEFSKFLFWNALVCFALAVLVSATFLSFLSGLLLWLAIFQFLFCFVRALSRNLPRREAENAFYLGRVAKLKNEQAARKDRFSQRKNYKFFKCPGCGKWLRVPRGKGRIHINCGCGYTLYRKT